MKIILVEDNKYVRKFLIAFLSPHYDLEIYESTIEAWEKIKFYREENFLVLTDVDMPGAMNGIEFLMKIKRKSSTIKVIVMSGDDSYEAQAVDRGANKFLAKSVSPSLLLETIKGLTTDCK